MPAGYLSIDVHAIPVVEWRGDRGKLDKDQSIALASNIFGWLPGRSTPIGPITHDEVEAQLLALWTVQPDEVRAALALQRLNVPMDRVLGALKREWFWGARELERLEALGSGHRLSGKKKR